MLVKVPVGCLIASCIFDVSALIVAAPILYLLSFYLVALALIVGVVAAGFGIADWSRLPSRDGSRSVGLGHGWIMSAVVLCYAYSFLLRFNSPSEPAAGAVSIALFGFALLIIGAQRGATLTSTFGAGTRFQGNTTRSDEQIARDEISIRRKRINEYSDPRQRKIGGTKL
jgi:uncharacterized membrane protein